MQNCNIWYISKYSSSTKYTIGTRQFYLSEEFVKKGFATTLFTSSNNHFRKNIPKYQGNCFIENINGVQTVWVKTNSYSKSDSVLRLISWIYFEILVIYYSRLIKNKPSYVIVSSLSLFSILSGFYFKHKFKAKLIFEVRDIWPLTLTEFSKLSRYNIFVFILSVIEKFGYKKADLIVGTMPKLFLHVNDIIKSNKKVIHIPQGFDFKYFDKKKDDQNFNQSNLNLNTDKFIVAYAGTFGKVNALEYFINAARIISAIDSNILFVLIGQGIQEEKLRQLASDLKNVTFMPKVDRFQLQLILQRVDLLYFATLNSKIYNFGISPNKLMDYFFSGKPILASFSGNDNVFLNSGACFVVPSEDDFAIANEILKIKNIAKSELIEIGSNGKKYLLKNHNFSTLAEKYLFNLSQL